MSDDLSAKVQQYFATVFDVLTKYKVHPSLYINVDETFNDASDDKAVKVFRLKETSDGFTKSAGKVEHRLSWEEECEYIGTFNSFNRTDGSRMKPLIILGKQDASAVTGSQRLWCRIGVWP